MITEPRHTPEQQEKNLVVVKRIFVRLNLVVFPVVMVFMVFGQRFFALPFEYFVASVFAAWCLFLVGQGVAYWLIATGKYRV